MPKRALRDHLLAVLARSVVLATCVVMGTFFRVIGAAEAPELAVTEHAVLRLAGDAFVAGELLASEEPGRLRWRSQAFVSPFEFPVDVVSAIEFPVAAGASRPAGEYCFELSGGDVLFGSLVRVGDGELEIDASGLGRLHVARERVERLYRWNSADFVHFGPNGLAGWREPDGASAWREEIGRPTTNQPRALLFGEFGMPTRAVVEFEVSWTRRADFALSLGVSEDGSGSARAYRFEVYPRTRESAGRVIAEDARQSDSIEWRYTTDVPDEDWFTPAFDDAHWSVGRSGFGMIGTPGAVLRTEWTSHDIWLRRTIDVASAVKGLALTLHHDDHAEVWINGQLVCQEPAHTSNYVLIPVEEASGVLRPGENVIAVHCHQDFGGQYIDVGLIDLGEATSDVVAVRESDHEADVAALASVGAGAGSTRLVAYLDQESGRLLVFSPDGAPLANLEVAPDPARSHGGGVLLENRGGDLRLERLRISPWDGVAPREVRADQPRLLRTDGSIVYGEFTTVDSATSQYVLRSADGDLRIDAARTAGIVLSPVERPLSAPFRAVRRDGTRVSGRLTRIGADGLELASPGIQEPLSLPLDGLASLLALNPPAREPETVPAPYGTLETAGLRLRGHLEDGREAPEASCLVWRPTGSTTVSALRPGVTGRLTYREPPPPLARQETRRSTNEPELDATKRRRAIHFRNGDSVPCEVSRIDEQGVRFISPLADASFVASDRVKALELIPAESPPRLERAKRERLLMLPRMQQTSPPTHLIRSTDGDYLRTRLLELSDEELRVEARAGEVKIPRDRISHVIWLHEDEIEIPAPTDETPDAASTDADPSVPPADARPTDAASPDAAALPEQTTTKEAPSAATRVQVRQTNGDRLTFSATGVTGGSLSGTSDVLGSCRIDLSKTDQLLIGDAVDGGPEASVYSAWKLHRATQPIYIQVLDGPLPAEAPPGLTSPLVGKPAPDFEVDLIDGRRFRLSDRKGRIVVLDFWATWCAPCLLTMPEIDREIRELNQLTESDVELIAVNLEEAPSQITPLLERHRLEMPVALDRDGVVAARYEVTSIPQTVVIDAEGKVTRLFVGGGPKAALRVRDAVRELIPRPDDDEAEE